MGEVWQHLNCISGIVKQSVVVRPILGGLTVLIVLQSMSSGGGTLPDIWLKPPLLTFCNEENHQSNLSWLLFPSSKLCCYLITVIIEQKMSNFKTFPGDPVDWTSLLLSSVALVLCSMLETTCRPWVGSAILPWFCCFGFFFFFLSASLLFFSELFCNVKIDQNLNKK